VEGVRCVKEAFISDVKSRFVVCSPRLLNTKAGRNIAMDISNRGILSEEIDDSNFDRIASTEHPQGVLLVCEEPKRKLLEFSSLSNERILLLDGIQDPGNFGTLIRTARGFGVSLLIALDGSVDPWNSKTVRASAGASFHVDIVRAPWDEVDTWLFNNKVEILVADSDGQNVSEVMPALPWVLVVGNEGAGLRSEILSSATHRVAIPMDLGLESFNVGVAGSILLYALTTQVR
jgi:TrmH family RNA methyltransferase